MTDRKKPRGEMLMDIGAQAVKVERGRYDVYAATQDHQNKLSTMCERYIKTQKLEP